MPGEIDLARMLALLDVEQRAGTFTFVTGEWSGDAGDVQATIVEQEGATWVVPVDAARAAGAQVEFEAAWLTLTVHSALAAVGLTAAVSRALADRGIACNMLAGYHHDHLLVPVERVADAIEEIRRLRAASGDG